MHFVVRNITYTPTTLGYLITCYTNNPCHLWFRYTTIEPQKHIIPRIVRGGQVGTYIDQCFVAFTDVEQNEAGDTFTHTFTVDPWPYCQTRWFYLWGNVDGNLSPSASALFYYHSTAMTLYCYNLPYNSSRSAPSGCTYISFPFKPGISYTIRHWKTHIRRVLYWTPQNCMEITLLTADYTGKPLSIIGYGFKAYFTLPPFPTWLDIDFPISPTPVVAGGQYAIAWRFTTGFKFVGARRLAQDGGHDDTCLWTLPPGQSYYYTACGVDGDNNCLPPPGPAGWLYHVAGGRQYYESFGTPT